MTKTTKPPPKPLPAKIVVRRPLTPTPMRRRLLTPPKPAIVRRKLTPPAEQTDRFQQITNQIVRAIEAGADPQAWRMPWHAVLDSGVPYNATTGKFYRGMNVMMLSCEAQAQAYPTNGWASWQQWHEIDATVRKGQKGSLICYYGVLTEPASRPDERERRRLFLRFSHVFNVAQVDDVPKKLTKLERPDTAKRVENAEQFVFAAKPTIVYGKGRAFYSPGKDIIGMPDRNTFKGTKTATATESYYGTLLHELVHWTGHRDRTNRINALMNFGSESYAFEELVAELGSAFLNGELGIRTTPLPDNAQYVASWLHALKQDKRAIFKAAAKATGAVEYLRKQIEERKLKT